MEKLWELMSDYTLYKKKITKIDERGNVVMCSQQTWKVTAGQWLHRRRLQLQLVLWESDCSSFSSGISPVDLEPQGLNRMCAAAERLGTRKSVIWRGQRNPTVGWVSARSASIHSSQRTASTIRVLLQCHCIAVRALVYLHLYCTSATRARRCGLLCCVAASCLSTSSCLPLLPMPCRAGAKAGTSR